MQLDENECNILELQNDAEMHIGFLKKLCNMTNRVKVFNEYFGARKPKYEQVFIKRKQRIEEQIASKRASRRNTLKKQTKNIINSVQLSNMSSKMGSVNSNNSPNGPNSFNVNRYASVTQPPHMNFPKDLPGIPRTVLSSPQRSQRGN